jgi:hypothetical protein
MSNSRVRRDSRPIQTQASFTFLNRGDGDDNMRVKKVGINELSTPGESPQAKGHAQQFVEVEICVNARSIIGFAKKW